MTKPAQIPNGCWPALMQAEVAAAYCGERTADSFMRHVGNRWPEPFIEDGKGKGKFCVWRKRDLDAIIHPDARRVGGDPAPL